MLAVHQRRERFRQLWGVSPLRINTKRTVMPRNMVVAVDAIGTKDQVKTEEINSTLADGRLEESFEEVPEFLAIPKPQTEFE